MTNDFKIVKIISDHEFIISAGLKQSVSEGDRFIIFDRHGEKILDPDSGESLGYLDVNKGTIIVRNVFENMSLASTEPHLVGGINNQFAGVNAFIGIKQPTPLKVDYSQITPLNESLEPSLIKLGDSVKPLDSGN
ncbi:hypothetical protein [Leuconostoc gasicomitatum]|uniref:hypothetical protein n=1 Tax=Leuconostoc gasicomitatum TaxID=115778 RepID=UPI0007449D68|nr:hypothetical protein [Leuconostoc gasicomitatum]MBZ5953704.1 hypothetical protein [Leuconostoc gasicomitatum]MBZ5954825.1 hypothetical protein [Leuconostoc gasicomitatum]MBZ5988952.1 hypothetical protein [Leuconostoc gasicomitatum]MBZ5989739.1 hypothetical protein [Leuconostoc gasicomitatum]CUR64321.1 Uncharacterized protein LEKG_1734 [Leuconostoc gasicomitatum KG16-1]